ncbi:MAG TPA: hypothetical protein VMS08_05720 [Candidatus Saccharimonadia bacterium]|jgi:hypothetical protein|nr:hypothetical protein [Candidatus Saccharimonadia bacterium]
MSLIVVHFPDRRKQMHCSVPPVDVAGSWIVFEDDTSADIDSEVSAGPSAVRFVREGDAGYLDPSTQFGSGITVVTVTEQDGTTIMSSPGGSVVKSQGGKYSVNLGPVDPSHGVQIGHGNIQINKF